MVTFLLPIHEFSGFLIFDGLCTNVGQRDDGSVPVFVRDFLPVTDSRGNLSSQFPLMPLSGQANRARVCPLLEQQWTKLGSNPRRFVRECPKADMPLAPPSVRFTPRKRTSADEIGMLAFVGKAVHCAMSAEVLSLAGADPSGICVWSYDDVRNWRDRRLLR